MGDHVCTLPLRWSSRATVEGSRQVTLKVSPRDPDRQLPDSDDGWFWAAISGVCRRLSFDVLHNSKLCVAEVEFTVS